MNTIPIVLTFDKNMSFPASVCISSLLMSANPDTFYDIIILYSGEVPYVQSQDKIEARFTNVRIQYRSVGDTFKNAFEIRGITAATYYRLMAPEIIPEYDRVIYADVDILFRRDLSDVYEFDLAGNYAGAVYAINIGESEYVESMGLTMSNYFVAGFLLMDLSRMRADNLVEKFLELAKNRYKYQDQDILNIVCKDRISALPRSASMGVSDFLCLENLGELKSEKYANTSYDEALNHSNIHYNGQKPWKDLCPNFDIWWEYYRKSPVFDSKFYFKFYYNKLEYLDKLPLKKRIKVLARYFVFGQKKDI